MDDNLGAALATAARTISNPNTLDDTLNTIVETATDSLPGFDAVGISILDTKRGKVHTRAGTSSLVWELDRIQYDGAHGPEGPCVDSLSDNAVVSVPHLAQEDRWPHYVPQAVTLGLKSQLGVRLYLDGEGTIGCLNIYSTTDEVIDADAVSIAGLFAAHAAIALGNATEVDTLQEALRTRTAIGVALGLLMAQYSVSQDAAFGLMVRTSSHSNTKIRDIAVRMVDEANAKAFRETR